MSRRSERAICQKTRRRPEGTFPSYDCIKVNDSVLFDIVAPSPENHDLTLPRKLERRELRLIVESNLTTGPSCFARQSSRYHIVSNGIGQQDAATVQITIIDQDFNQIRLSTPGNGSRPQCPDLPIEPSPATNAAMEPETQTPQEVRTVRFTTVAQTGAR
jgi:hypothetical protein